jgi:hypothetical protein
MKTLEKFSELKVSAEEQEMVNGGVPVSGSGSAPNGSKYSYDGDLSQTHTGTAGGSIGIFSGSSEYYSKDFVGTVYIDGCKGVNQWVL